MRGATIAHHLVGLDVNTGPVLLHEVVDPPGSVPAAQPQRTARTLDLGSVLIGFGGNAGECATCHGWVVSAGRGLSLMPARA